ncbi:hypothetical protein BCON_0039g00320 [Botryotinia convoluta]|uniref:Uncharacterized protein n=1 Tax=Botryotinia convoluta TaxID=54673 RepID=A0A4Z1IEF4_9HELO|nr:hypothetical protein BCON_0039g00320 [Botryotinia convoluta]
MLPIEPVIEGDIEEISRPESFSSGLNPNDDQAHESRRSQRVIMMAAALQKTDALDFRLHTAAGNLSGIRNEVKTLRYEIVQHFMQDQELEIQYEEEVKQLRQELSDVRKKNEQLKTDAVAIRETSSALQKENTKLLHELDCETEKCVMHQRVRHNLTHQLELSVDAKDYFEVNEENMRLLAQVEVIEREKANLQSHTTELVTDLTVKEPLMLVGAAVRLRFLEQAKDVVFNRRVCPEPNRELRDEGNVAAQFGHIIADESLFKIQYIPRNSIEMTRKIFKELYQCYPDRRLYSDPLEIRLSNILAANRAPRRTESSRSQRKDLMEMYQQLQILQDSENPSNLEISNHVTAIELLTDDIIDLDLRTRRG